MREAAGYILFCDAGGVRRYLLLRNARHGTWAFPKGHLEPGEEPRAGARREVLEETGFRELREVPGFEREIRYRVPRSKGLLQRLGLRAAKRVRFFLAEVVDPAWTRSPEHDAGDWMAEDEVLAHLQHPDLAEIFKSAVAWLRDRPPPR